jgi:hypothetical protein
MVDLPGFPRPLYPPDANEVGKKPSMDGPDVIAYKRTACRLGRWGIWDPSSWDDSFSNAFAHGRGPNVADSGIAGIQRQLAIPDSGWIGEKTFNGLRSARVPEGPHTGEMAMDSVAQSLLVDAWDIFHGSPDPPATGSSAAARLSKAKSQIGVKESPAGSNHVKYCDWYGMLGPWCAMFVTWADQTGERPTSSFVRGQRYSYVPTIVNDARNGRYGLSVTSSPKPGDVVTYDWEQNGEPDHTGIFEGYVQGSLSKFTAIEGNTSIDSNSNGGEVMRRTRSITPQVVFIRVAE